MQAKLMRFRPRQEIGTILWQPTVYGRSHLGTSLEVWKPSGKCELLIHAGIHGEEAETTIALSRALRMLTEPSSNCAVILAVNPDGLNRGTRCNARGVDLNRNFPTTDWKSDPVEHRSTLDDPRDVRLSPGSSPASEAEVRALIRLIAEMQPDNVVALHAPLACIDDAKQGPLAHWLAERTGLELVADVGYPTPGSFGTWGGEQGVGVITYELPLTTIDAVVREHVPVLAELISGEAAWS
jgi:protein MpaA